MLPEIKEAYLNGRLVLLLGAGASHGSKTASGDDVPMAGGLAKKIAEGMGFSYDGEDLPIIYSAAVHKHNARLKEILDREFLNCSPSRAYKVVARYPWPRLYTLNIDEAFDRALKNDSPQKVRVMGRRDSIVDQDMMYSNLEYIKLNGCIARISDGLVFSPQEYGVGSAQLPPWYEELAQDYFKYIFLFIGTKINEPIFFHALERHKQTFGENEPSSYVLTRSASPIEVEHLKALNLTHIKGTFEDFADWLAREIPNSPKPIEVAVKRRPELGAVLDESAAKYNQTFNSILLVTRSTLPKQRTELGGLGQIRNFYKGFKPSWPDIVDDIPAKLSFTSKFYSILDALAPDEKLIGIVGPAGSGKTTLSMMSSLYLSKNNVPVYYLREPVSNIGQIINDLEEVNRDKYAVFIDRVDPMAEDLASVLASGRLSHGVIVFSERQSIWEGRVKARLGRYCSNVFKTDVINASDVAPLLSKLKKYGPWTRLEQLSIDERKKELLHNSRRQLLIGLLETTAGEGFERIISRDYDQLSETQRAFLVLVGLATVHRLDVPISLVGRALSAMGIFRNPHSLVGELSGTVYFRDEKLSARHPTYVRRLFEIAVAPEFLRKCVVALLSAFADYGTPVMRHVEKNEGLIFKSVINNRFLREHLRRQSEEVLSVYRSFETVFHTDGLYWLQYGLALRGFKQNIEALEKLKTARDAYHSPQIEHAYAQQLLILASELSEAAPALDYAHEAKGILNDLIAIDGSDDSYPYVTLAEGFTSVVRKHQGDKLAREAAKGFANQLMQQRKKLAGDQRFENALRRMVSFSSTGHWDDEPYWIESSERDPL